MPPTRIPRPPAFRRGRGSEGSATSSRRARSSARTGRGRGRAPPADPRRRLRLPGRLPPAEPDAPVFTPDDAAILRAFQVGAELFGQPFVLPFARVVGSALARIAEATIALYLVNVER